jgi:SAM-dependent methyltransferase
MAVNHALLQTQHAFDGVAAAYDRSNADNAILRAMRTRVWQVLERHAPRGADILDLGCGPGCDAEYLALRGHRVTAIDWSPAMVEEARRRVRTAGLAYRVDVRYVGIHEVDRLTPADAQFDVAFSNFGPLNCIDDLPAAASLIAARVRPGGLLIASVIGRVCPWELVRYGAAGHFARAAVRFRRGLVPVPLDGRTVWTRYYLPGEFARVFTRAGFARVSVRALGLFVPPPYLESVAERRPALVAALQKLEDRVGDWPGIRAWGDHFLIVLRKA